MRLHTCALAFAALLTGAGQAGAHGGSHPAPWPVPSYPANPEDARRRPPGHYLPGGSTSSWEHWWERNKWWVLPARRGVRPTVSKERRSALGGWPLERCDDEYYDIRSAAALALGKAGDRRATLRLATMMGDRNKEVAESAAIGVGLLRDPSALPALSAVLRSGAEPPRPARFRAAAALALGLTRSASATEPLAIALEADPEKEVQYACAVALGLLKHADAARRLHAVLADPERDRNVRAHAAAALGKCGVRLFASQSGGEPVRVSDELARWLTRARKDRGLRRSCVLALGALGAIDKHDHVVAALESDRDRLVQQWSLIALARLARAGHEGHRVSARARIEPYLTGRTHALRGFAALALGVLGETKSAPALRSGLAEQSDPSIRASCAVALGLLRDGEAASALREVLASSRNVTLRGYCGVALALIGQPEDRARIRALVVGTTPPDVKASAAIALAWAGDQPAVASLVTVVGGESNYARGSALVALSLLRAPAAIDPIRKAFASGQLNRESQTFCVVALGGIADRSGWPALSVASADLNFALPGEMFRQLLKLH